MSVQRTGRVAERVNAASCRDFALFTIQQARYFCSIRISGLSERFRLGGRACIPQAIPRCESVHNSRRADLARRGGISPHIRDLAAPRQVDEETHGEEFSPTHGMEQGVDVFEGKFPGEHDETLKNWIWFWKLRHSEEHAARHYLNVQILQQPRLREMEANMVSTAVSTQLLPKVTVHLAGSPVDSSATSCATTTALTTLRQSLWQLHLVG